MQRKRYTERHRKIYGDRGRVTWYIKSKERDMIDG